MFCAAGERLAAGSRTDQAQPQPAVSDGRALLTGRPRSTSGPSRATAGTLSPYVRDWQRGYSGWSVAVKHCSFTGVYYP
jgi:hypothetical protein